MTDIGTPVMPGPAASQELPRLARVLAVCAHPDDESSGLGAVLAALAGAGTSSSVLCFTHGEVSTLGLGAGDLRRVRADELAAAAAALGTGSTGLVDYPDGRLCGVRLSRLAGQGPGVTSRQLTGGP